MPTEEIAEMADNTNEQATEMEATDNAEAQGTVDTDSVAELERVRKALADANREAAKRRKQLEAYEKAEEERKQASMSELEKAQAALAQWQQKAERAEEQRRQALVKAAVIAKAGALRFNNAEDALAFIKMESLEIGDDGQVKGLDDQLKDIAESRPYLLQQAGAVGATNPGRASTEGESASQRRARLYGLDTGNPFQGPGGGLILPS